MAAEEDNLEIDIYGDGGEENNVEHGADLQEGVRQEGQEWLDDQKSQPEPPTAQDERPIDPGATTALLISDLHWWITEDDIRGWANQAACEDELKDVTFSEHKVNGKSKGQAFVALMSPPACTALKRKISSFGSDDRKYPATYTNPLSNPFKTLPKDAPARAKDNTSQRSTSTGNYQGSNNSFRGSRGGFNRGNMNNMAYNNNRNFSNPNYSNNFGFNRGGMMGNQFSGGMRGGMMGNQFGSMRGRGMMSTGQMPMNPMMGGMGMTGAAFPQGGGHFNPAFFGHNPAGDWNPHGVKRTRQD